MLFFQQKTVKQYTPWCRLITSTSRMDLLHSEDLERMISMDFMRTMNSMESMGSTNLIDPWNPWSPMASKELGTC